MPIPQKPTSRSMVSAEFKYIIVITVLKIPIALNHNILYKAERNINSFSRTVERLCRLNFLERPCAYLSVD